MIELLEKIPSSFWIAVIASSITLIGVIISNKSNFSRLRFQISQDSVIRRREKDREEKRKEYKIAASKIGEMIHLLQKLQNAEIKDVNSVIMEMHSLSLSAQTCMLVASPSVIIAIGETSLEITKVMFEILKERVNLNEYDKEREEKEDEFEEVMKEIKILEEVIMNMGKSDISDLSDQKFSLLSNAKSILDDIERLNITRFSHQSQNGQRIFEMTIHIFDKSRKLIDIMRTDAGFDRLTNTELIKANQKIFTETQSLANDFHRHIFKTISKSE
jgi:hypothetical protein